MCSVFFNQNTAYEMRISDWSSDVCSSDLPISVAAVSAERLQAAGVVSIQQLSSAVAGLTVNQTTSYFSPHLRGVGTSFFGPAIENPVGLYVDRKSVVSGKSVSVRVDLGGRRIIKQKKTLNS